MASNLTALPEALTSYFAQVMNTGGGNPASICNPVFLFSRAPGGSHEVSGEIEHLTVSQ